MAMEKREGVPREEALKRIWLKVRNYIFFIYFWRQIRVNVL